LGERFIKREEDAFHLSMMLQESRYFLGGQCDAIQPDGQCPEPLISIQALKG